VRFEDSSTPHYLPDTRDDSLDHTLLLYLQDHMFTTRWGELALVAGEVELAHDRVAHWLCLLIDAYEGDEESCDHGR